MRSLRIVAILPALLLALGSVRAEAFSLTPDSVICEGDLVVDTTTDPGKVFLSCSGPLSFGDGTLTSDAELVVTAPSVIFLGEVTLDAPVLGIDSALVMAGSNAQLIVRAAPILTTSSSPSIASGATISIAGEPAAPMTPVSNGGSIQLASGGSISVQAGSTSTTTPTVAASTLPGSDGQGGGGALDLASVIGLGLLAWTTMTRARRSS